MRFRMNRGVTWVGLLALTAAGGCYAKSMSQVAWLAVAGESGNYPTDSAYPEDAEVDRWLTRLDSLLSLPETAADFEREALYYLRAFGRYVQMALLTPQQTGRIVAFLEEVRARHPDSGELIDKNRRLVENLTPGKVAPNIRGRDIEGVPFQLEDYRGNIVVLIFSGHWCGPCRAEYPYQRRMLSRYKGDKVVLLGVNSDSDFQTIVRAKAREGLDYRTWWDGSTQGPISTDWNVWGWPSTFLLDEDGVILHVNKRRETLIKAVDAVLARTKMGEK